MTRSDYRTLLRMAKTFVKMQGFIENNNISQSALSRFINYDNFDIIGDKSLDTITNEIYNACCAYCHSYEEYKKIA